jgi:hypothetical protein
MRSWVIIVASAVAGTIADAVLVLTGGLPARVELAAFLLAHWPALAVVWLAGYGAAALGLTTSAVFVEIRSTAPRPVGHEWAWRYVVRLAATQYFTCVVALLGLAALSVSVEAAPFQVLPAPLAALPALGAGGGVVVIGLLGWLSLSAAAIVRGPALPRPPIEGPEMRLLREILVQLRVRPPAPPGDAQLAELIEPGQRAVLEVVKDLATAVNRLNRALRKDLEDIKEALRERPAGAGTDSSSAMENAAAELRSATAALDASLTRLGEMAALLPSNETPPVTELDTPISPGSRSHLSSELQELLRAMAPRSG